MECVICFGPLTYAHMGINSCRACAVFYKRAVESKSALKCRRGDGECMNLDPKSSCRLCRFERIKEILRVAVGDEESNDSDIVEEKECEESGSSTFITHESYYDRESTTTQTPLLDKLRKGYSLACLIRYAGEQGTRTKIDEKLEIRSGNLILVPCTYASYPVHRKICHEAMKAFASHAFDDFQQLDNQCKDFIIYKSLGSLIALDASYRATHHFPNDDEMRIPGYTTYVKQRDLDKFFSNTPDNIDSTKMAGEVRTSLDTSVNVARRFYKRITPTDYEFLALLGLALWNDETSNLNQKLSKMASENRAVIMQELHTYYSQQGIADYAARIGDLHCIIVNFQNNVARLHEDFEFYKLNNLFNDYIEHS